MVKKDKIRNDEEDTSTSTKDISRLGNLSCEDLNFVCSS